MNGHLFAFDCPHCTTTITYRNTLKAGVADCTGCGAQFRIDVAVAGLRGSQILQSMPHDAVCRDPHAAGAPLLAAIAAADREAAA